MHFVVSARERSSLKVGKGARRPTTCLNYSVAFLVPTGRGTVLFRLKPSSGMYPNYHVYISKLLIGCELGKSQESFLQLFGRREPKYGS